MAIDWASMTDEEIAQELDAGHAETTKRRDLEAIPEQMDSLNKAYLTTEGTAPGEPWRLPAGAHDSYPIDWLVTHNAKTWRSLITGNVYEPGVSGWREELGEGEYGAWVQPSGAHDAYHAGEEVTHNAKYWRSDVDANVWEPGVSGWTEFTPGGTEPPPEPEIEAWVQPTGAHDAYNTGDQVHHNGNLWTSLVDANVWEPPTQWSDEGPYTPS